MRTKKDGIVRLVEIWSSSAASFPALSCRMMPQLNFAHLSQWNTWTIYICAIPSLMSLPHQDSLLSKLIIPFSRNQTLEAKVAASNMFILMYEAIVSLCAMQTSPSFSGDHAPLPILMVSIPNGFAKYLLVALLFPEEILPHSIKYDTKHK